MNSLDKFVKQVADTIKENHNKSGSEASFIFGISGKWGEGKTVFLNKLEPVLVSKGFVVARINPWKYAQDRISFLRSFLKQLSRATKKKQGKFDKFRAFINNENEFRNLDYDVSELNIHVGLLAAVILFLIAAFIIYLNYEVFWNLVPHEAQIWLITQPLLLQREYL